MKGVALPPTLATDGQFPTERWWLQATKSMKQFPTDVDQMNEIVDPTTPNEGLQAQTLWRPFLDRSPRNIGSAHRFPVFEQGASGYMLLSQVQCKVQDACRVHFSHSPKRIIALLP